MITNSFFTALLRGGPFPTRKNFNSELTVIKPFLWIYCVTDKRRYQQNFEVIRSIKTDLLFNVFFVSIKSQELSQNSLKWIILPSLEVNKSLKIFVITKLILNIQIFWNEFALDILTQVIMKFEKHFQNNHMWSEI